MRTIFFSLMLLSCIGLFMRCKQAHKTDKLEAWEERVFVVNLVDDSVKLKEYLRYHEEIWPEVEMGFKKAGYKKVALYRFKNLLVMNITVPVGADLDEMGKIAESYSPRCKDWNQLMEGYQQGIDGTEPGQKWVEAQQFYTFE